MTTCQYAARLRTTRLLTLTSATQFCARRYGAIAHHARLVILRSATLFVRPTVRDTLQNTERFGNTRLTLNLAKGLLWYSHDILSRLLSSRQAQQRIGEDSSGGLLSRLDNNHTVLERRRAASTGPVVGGLLSVGTIAANCVLGNGSCSLPRCMHLQAPWLVGFFI